MSAKRALFYVTWVTGSFENGVRSIEAGRRMGYGEGHAEIKMRDTAGCWGTRVLVTVTT